MNTTRAEAILKLSAYVAGVLYCCGALVTVVSLRRYGIYDLSLLNVAYIMRGVPFLVHLLLPLALPLAVANFGYHMYRSDLVKGSPPKSRNRPVLLSIARTVFAEFLFAPVLFVLASLVLLAFRHPSTLSLFSLDTLRYLWLPYFNYRILFVPLLLAAGTIHVIFGDYRAAGLLHDAARIGFGIILVAAGAVLYTQFYNDCLFSEIAPSLGGGAPVLATAIVSEPTESPNGMMNMQIRRGRKMLSVN